MPPKFERMEREEVMAKVAVMNRRGYSQWDIAREVNVTQGQVSMYLATIKKRYVETQVWSRAEEVEQEVDRLKFIMKEAFDAWDASKEDKCKIIDESVTSDFGEKIKLGKVKEKQTGNSQYLAIILDCIKQIRELKGLDAPKKIEATVQTLDWTPLVSAATTKPRDEVEEAIAQAGIGYKNSNGEQDADHSPSGQKKIEQPGEICKRSIELDGEPEGSEEVSDDS
jgi:predicted transcriptional regulator